MAQRRFNRQQRSRNRSPSNPYPAPSLDLRTSTWHAAAPLCILRGIRAILHPPAQSRARFAAFPCVSDGRRPGCGRTPCLFAPCPWRERSHVGDLPNPAALVPIATSHPARVAAAAAATTTAPNSCAGPHPTPRVYAVSRGHGGLIHANAWRRSATAVSPSHRVTAHLQLDSCRTLRARVADFAVAHSRDSRALARVLIQTVPHPSGYRYQGAWRAGVGVLSAFQVTQKYLWKLYTSNPNFRRASSSDQWITIRYQKNCACSCSPSCRSLSLTPYVLAEYPSFFAVDLLDYSYVHFFLCVLFWALHGSDHLLNRLVRRMYLTCDSHGPFSSALSATICFVWRVSRLVS